MIIKDAKYITSAPDVAHFPESLPEFVFCGRSNVGKSSFINMILNRNNLARTSSKPGKTQLLNLFLINNSFYFVDVPGYGYANVSKEQMGLFAKRVNGYFRDSKNLKCAFLLVDSRHDPTSQDIQMLEYCKEYNIPHVIVMTKSDGVGTTKIYARVKATREVLGLDKDDKIIVSSTLKKKGIKEAFEVIESYLGCLNG
jgi:GTP-binding protein